MRFAHLDNHFPTDPAVLTTHVASLGGLIAAALGYLPAVVALIPATYYLILIYESKTVQAAMHCHRRKKMARMRRKARKHKVKHEAHHHLPHLEFTEFLPGHEGVKSNHGHSEQ